MSETSRRLLEEAEKRLKTLEDENRQLRAERGELAKTVDEANVKVAAADVEMNRMRGMVDLQTKIAGFQKSYLSLLEMAGQLDAQVNPKPILDIQQKLRNLEDMLPKHLSEAVAPFKSNLDQSNTNLTSISDVLRQFLAKLDALEADLKRMSEPSEEEKTALKALAAYVGR